MNEPVMLKKFRKSFEIKMSPDGKYISHNGGSVNLIDTENYTLVANFRDIKYPNHLCYSYDSKLLAVKSTQRKIAIYDLENQKLINIYRLKRNSQPQDCGFCFTVDNKYILNLVYTNELLGYISKIDIETFEEERFFEECTYAFESIQYVSERKQYLISGFDRNKQVDKSTSFIMWYTESDNLFELVDLDTQIQQMLYHNETKTFIGWSLSGKDLIIFSNKYQVENKLNVVTDKQKTINSNNVLDESEGLKGFMEHEQSGTADLGIKLNDLGIFTTNEEGYIRHICFSKNGKYLAIVLSEIVKIYEYPTLKFLNSISNRYTCYAEFAEDDKYLLIGTWENGFIYELNL